MPPDISWDVRDLLLKLLQKDPKVRLGAKGAHEIKAHTFFKVTAVLHLDQALYMCYYCYYRPMTTKTMMMVMIMMMMMIVRVRDDHGGDHDDNDDVDDSQTHGYDSGDLWC